MACSSSSAPPQEKNFDVFLSFRGEDTRNTFTSHLYAALCRKRIQTFIDNQLIRGDEIESSLLNTIKASKISIIIFSENYADSGWCLQELEQILECRNTYGQIVIPVFYHIAPSHVRNLTGAFGDAYFKLQERFKERSDDLQRWKAAMKEAANLSGWTSNDETPESVLIEAIVGNILERLNSISPISDNKNLIGVESVIRNIESSLYSGSEGVHIVGITGIGGIGKTTIAHAVFDTNSSKFDGSYFFENIREESENNRLSHLKNEFLSTVLQDKYANLELTFTKKRLESMRILIVFDDVTCLEQVQKLIGEPYRLGTRSRIIITTRNKQVLKSCGVCDANIYNIGGLHWNDAIQLFSQYAFKQDCPAKDYIEVTNKVVSYTQGHPLALKVLGSALLCKGKEIWEDAISKLEKCPPLDVYKVLKVSYDGLDKEEQDIFLYIACFFKWKDINLVKGFLNACDFATEYVISILIDKNLIIISGNVVTMHDLLQEMGREIVREESGNDHGKYSRLWYHEDIYQVLTKNKGTKAIKGIQLDLSKTKEMNLNYRAFAKMSNLRFLDFCCSNANLELNYSSCSSNCSCNEENFIHKVHISQCLKIASSDLIYFRWHGFPHKSFPSRFHPNNFFALVMPYSEVTQLWNGVQHLGNLRHINLSYSKHLTKIPDLSLASNLESLILQGCRSLIGISSSFKDLNKLVILNLRDCKSLRILPRSIHSKCLIKVCLSGCSNLEMVPMLPCNVSVLELDGTAIREFPLIEYPSRLIILNLKDCSSLESLPSSFSQFKFLRSLTLSGCSKVERLPEDLGSLEALEDLKLNGLPLQSCKSQALMGSGLNCLLGLSSLKFLSLGHCGITELPKNFGLLYSVQELYLDGNNFESLPASIKDLSKLSYLDLGGCKRLQFIPEFSKYLVINADNCISLEGLLDLSNVFFRLNLSNCFKLDGNTITEKVKYDLQRIQRKQYGRMHRGSICYPGSQIPEFFRFQSTGSSMTIELPKNWKNKNLLGLAMCAVVEFPDHFVSYGFEVDCDVITKPHDDYEIEVRRGNMSAWSYEDMNLHDYGASNLAIHQDHVLVGFDTLLFETDEVSITDDEDEYAELIFSNRALIKFNAYDSECDAWSYRIKKCGVDFLYAVDCGEEINRSCKSNEEENGGPLFKRLKVSNSNESPPLTQAESHVLWRDKLYSSDYNNLEDKTKDSDGNFRSSA